MKKQTIWAACKYFLGFAVLFWVIWRNWNPPDGYGPGLSQALQNPIRVGPLCACALIYMSGVLLTFFRWYLLVRAQDLPLSLFNALRLGLVGFYFSSFLPSSIGGDIVKAVMIAREQRRRTVAVATVLIDRALGLWGLVWVVVLLGAFFWAVGNPVFLENPKLRVIVFVCAVWSLARRSSLAWPCSCCLRSVPRSLPTDSVECRKSATALAEFWRAILDVSVEATDAWRKLLCSFQSAAMSASCLRSFLPAKFSSIPDNPDTVPTLSQDFLIVPIGCAIQAVFPSPGGMGAGEYGFGKPLDDAGGQAGSSRCAGVLGRSAS